MLILVSFIDACRAAIWSRIQEIILSHAVLCIPIIIYVAYNRVIYIFYVSIIFIMIIALTHF